MGAAEAAAGAARAIARLNRNGAAVVLCTNQPEVEEGIVNRRQLDEIHRVLRKMLARHDAYLDLVLCCTDDYRSEWRKPSPGMLLEAMRRFGAKEADPPFVGDQKSDLVAATKAHCQPVLVRTGLGRRTEADGVPQTARPAAIHDDLMAFAAAYCG